MEHSPLPWALRPRQFDDWGTIRDADGNFVAKAKIPAGLSEDELNKHRRDKTDPAGQRAALIIHAVNLHAELVRALQEAETCLAAEWIVPTASERETLKHFRALIAKAKEQL